MTAFFNIRFTITCLIIYIILDSLSIMNRISEYDKKGILFVHQRETIIFQYKFLSKKIIEFLLTFKVFKTIIFLRLIVAILIILFKPFPFLVLIIFLIQLFLHLRNDSLFSLADRFVLTILLAISIYYNFQSSEKIQNYSIYFIGTLTLISYFFTAFYKLKSKSWKNGVAIEQVLSTDLYGNEKYYSFLINHKFLSRFLNYSTIVFQLLAPLTIVSSKFTLIYLILGFVFHLSIALIMNLNNFFWVFVSTYPCIYILSIYTEKYFF